MVPRGRIWSVVALGAFASAACGAPDRAGTVDDDCVGWVLGWEREVTHVDEVDLLFVVDSSMATAPFRDDARAEITRMVATLVSGDLEFLAPPGSPRQGLRDFAPVIDLQVGVISADLGTPGVSRADCEADGPGTDGLLATGDREGRRCGVGGQTVRRFVNRTGRACGDDPARCRRFAEDVACVVDGLGDDGCPYQQPLEAALRALMPADPDACSEPFCAFHGGGRGHGPPGGANAGFLRERSLLAIVFVTAADDCTSAEPAVYTPSTVPPGGAAAARCARSAEQLVDVQRHVEGLLSLRQDPFDLFVGVIGGFPVQGLRNHVSDETGLLDFQGILDDPEMVYRPESGRELAPSCVSELGSATPSRRMVSAAAALSDRGASVELGSICQPSWMPVTLRLIERLSSTGWWWPWSCLERPLSRSDEGLVRCRVEEVLPPGRRCVDIPGRRAVGSTGEGRALCEVRQIPIDPTDPEVPPYGRPGWFYDDFSSAALNGCSSPNEQRIGYAEGADPRNGSIVWVQCLADQSGCGLDAGLR